jgi:hypothetical protein
VIIERVISHDGNIRSVKVNLASGRVLNRPLNLGYPLECSHQDRTRSDTPICDRKKYVILRPVRRRLYERNRDKKRLSMNMVLLFKLTLIKRICIILQNMCSNLKTVVRIDICCTLNSVLNEIVYFYYCFLSSNHGILLACSDIKDILNVTLLRYT